MLEVGRKDFERGKGGNGGGEGRAEEIFFKKKRPLRRQKKASKGKNAGGCAGEGKGNVSW